MNLIEKINIHGTSLKKDALFSVVRSVIVAAVMCFIFRKEIDTFVILLIVMYLLVAAAIAQRRIKRDKIFYTFEPGNPTYDALKEYGDPVKICNGISDEVTNGKVVYSKLAKPKKASAETVITESYFVHLCKKAIVIPLNKIVCAYLYDNVTKMSPEDKFLPTVFKPIHLIITYGEKKEAIILYSELEYKKVLAILDEKLHCKVIYTREMGTLFNTDYKKFLKLINRTKNAPLAIADNSAKSTEE